MSDNPSAAARIASIPPQPATLRLPAPALSEEALALQFADRHADELRYVSAWGRWFVWSGVRWEPEETLLPLDLARRICRDAANRAESAGRAAKLAAGATVAAVERLARADRRLAATPEIWDRDPDLLNTPAGIVDLKTGTLQGHRRENFSTKAAAVAPAPAGTQCPLWTAFLHRITDGDRELSRYLQLLSGYCLTGSTREHALFFGHGTGRNGKSVFVNTLSGILGDYAAIAPMETFVASHGDRHPTELAALRGARLVVASETESNRKWAEARIKQITGGDPIAARFMRKDFFTFTPTFKLFVVGNHKPSLASVDEAIRARLHLVPFVVTIPAEERDADLPEKLRAEWPAILRWAIEGALLWRTEGLPRPRVVQAATDEYLADEDVLSLWIEDRCRRSPLAHETASDLFASWRAWAEAAGEAAGSQKAFSQGMQARGFEKRRQGGTGRAGFAGIELRRPDYTVDPRLGGTL